MAQPSNSILAQRLLAAIGEGTPADTIAAMFSDDAAFEIPGDDGVLPWIGRRTGRHAVVDFITDVRALTEPLAFEVADILATDTHAVIVGELATRIKATAKVVETDFAIILTTSGGQITRFQMLEDSFAVSRAARA
jgi:ketosteroid isomerase-like protein